MTEVIDSSVAYFVRNEHDSTVLLALDVKHHDGIIEWHDTQRDRAFHCERLNPSDDGFTAETENGAYAFSFLDLDLYKIVVQQKLVGTPEFSSTSELQKYFQRFVRGI